MFPPTLGTLFENAASGSLSGVEEAIAAGADVNGVYQGQSILGVAALSGHIAVIARLLAAGAAVDGPPVSPNGEGPRDTPLTAALQSSQLDVPGKAAVLRTLVEEGADVSLPNGAGQSPLFIACDGAKWDPLGYVLIDVLVEAGSQVESTLQALEARYQEELCFDMMSEAESAAFRQLLERLRQIDGVGAPRPSPQAKFPEAIPWMDLEGALPGGAHRKATEAIDRDAHPDLRNGGRVALLHQKQSAPMAWATLRGVAAFDIDEQVVLLQGSPKHVATSLRGWLGGGYVQVPLEGDTRGIIQGPRSFIIYQFQGHDWTLVEALMPGIAPGFSDVPQALSEAFPGEVLAYQNSPMIGESSLRSYRGGEVTQAMVPGAGSDPDGGFTEAVDAYLREAGGVAPGGSLRHLPGDRLSQLSSLGIECVVAFVVAPRFPIDPIGLDDFPL